LGGLSQNALVEASMLFGALEQVWMACRRQSKRPGSALVLCWLSCSTTCRREGQWQLGVSYDVSHSCSWRAAVHCLSFRVLIFGRLLLCIEDSVPKASSVVFVAVPMHGWIQIGSSMRMMLGPQQSVYSSICKLWLIVILCSLTWASCFRSWGDTSTRL
jgi:hypothetical protein